METSEEYQREKEAKKQFEIELMRDCFQDARTVLKYEQVKPTGSRLLAVAVAFFRKRRG